MTVRNRAAKAPRAGVPFRTAARRLPGLTLALTFLVAGVGSVWGPGSTTTSASTSAPTSAGITLAAASTGRPAMTGLHAVGNTIQNSDGTPVRLLGVNHSGSEYSCVGGSQQNGVGYGIMEPDDFAGNGRYLDAISSWGANTIRVGLNEDCWLGINGVASAYSAANYQNELKQLVAAASARGLAVVLELHWSAPGTFVAHGQAPMPDRDHTVEMWRQTASTFKDDSSVVFDLFNEPYPYWNQDDQNGWQCWRDGSDPADPGNTKHCIGTEWWDLNGNAFNGGAGYQYAVAGMQELVTTVRNAGANNLVMLGGLEYSNDLSQWLAYKPTDTVNNLAASWHVYDNNVCANADCWNRQVAPVAAAVPLVVGELGEYDCSGKFIDPLMSWLDEHKASYLAWTWNEWGCGGLQLMNSYTDPTPTAYGKAVYDHLQAATGAGTSSPDTTAPTAPSALAGTASGPSSVKLTWKPSTDDVGVAQYRVWCWTAASGWQQVSTVPGNSTSAEITGLKPDTDHVFGLRSFDAAGNESNASNLVRVQTPKDTTAPTAPSGLVAGTPTSTSVGLTWKPSTDDVGVAGYRIWCWSAATNWQLASTAPGDSTSTEVSGRRPGTRYVFGLRSFDSAGNESDASNLIEVTTSAP